MPTASLNLYRGRFSHVGWHSDDEPLLGEHRETKLIVSVSFGTWALFKWKGKSCPSKEGNSCWLGHGDILVMDGQCQDEFLHCSNPGLEQERINVTFRWIKQLSPSSSFLRAGVACCLPACVQGYSVPGTEVVGKSSFWAFWLLLGALCILGVLALLVYPVCARLGSQRCASCWTRPLGGGRWGHYLCDPRGVCSAAQNTAIQACGKSYYFDGLKLYIVRCVLPLGAGRFMHMVVLYGYPGADTDAEQFALTDKLFDAALGELSVPEGSPACWLEIFNVEPTKIPCLSKGISAGLWFDLEASWALPTGEQPASTCTRSWSSSGGHRRDFMVGCPLAAAAVLSCTGISAGLWAEVGGGHYLCDFWEGLLGSS